MTTDPAARSCQARRSGSRKYHRVGVPRRRSHTSPVAPGGTYPFAVVMKGNDTAYVSSDRDREVVAVDVAVAGDMGLPWSLPRLIGAGRARELSLLPRVREADADTLIIADGTSCRHQIHDGAQRMAVHAAVVLAAQLG